MGFANLLYLPIANRLRAFHYIGLYQEMTLEGLCIAHGRTARRLKRRWAYLRGVAMRKRYRLHLQGREHLDRWLVSYADYMTLIFALFRGALPAAIVNRRSTAPSSRA